MLLTKCHCHHSYNSCVFFRHCRCLSPTPAFWDLQSLKSSRCLTSETSLAASKINWRRQDRMSPWWEGHQTDSHTDICPSVYNQKHISSIHTYVTHVDFYTYTSAWMHCKESHLTCISDAKLQTTSSKKSYVHCFVCWVISSCYICVSTRLYSY